MAALSVFRHLFCYNTVLTCTLQFSPVKKENLVGGQRKMTCISDQL